MLWEVSNKMLRKIRSLVLNSSFIEIYDNALSHEECDILISRFERSEQGRGAVWNNGQMGIDLSVKDSIELPNLRFSNGDLISNLIRTKLQFSINKYIKKYSHIPQLNTWGVEDGYTFKKFEKGGGYKSWHHEHGPKNQSERILAWMFYLNDASGTEFMHYPTVRAKIGRCVIWPAGLTHMHKSQINKGLKYIISGWIGYEE